MGKPNTKEESKSNSTSGELGMAFNEDEDDDVFQDALETLHEHSFVQSTHVSYRDGSLENRLSRRSVQPSDLNKIVVQEEDDDEPLEREELPWLKDPNAKVSIWAIIKDSIGKDISKLSVPVYFNDATSLL